MDFLVLVTYGALCFLVFRFFKVPVNGFTVVTAVVGGVTIVAMMLLLVNFHHPFTNLGRTYFVSTPIVPAVRGRVTEVSVEANTPLKMGDVLFRIDPAPFEAAIHRLQAHKARVEAQVNQDNERLTAAEAQRNQADASLTLAQQQYDDDKQLVDKGVIPANRLDQRLSNLEAAKSAVEQSRAAVEQARAEIGAVTTDGRPAKLAEVESELERAQWDLEQTVMHAPADGYVTQLALTPGVIVVPFPLKPAMVFISKQERVLAAGFQQISVQRLSPGSEAEIAFHGVPGTVFTGKVRNVLDAMAAGQVDPSGTLIAPERRQFPGRVVVLIDLPEEVGNYNLPAGSMAAVAVYSDHWHALGLVRKILLRMKAWTYYLAIEH